MKAMTRWLTVAAIGSVAAVQMALAEGDKVRQNNGNGYGATPRTGVPEVLAADESVPAAVPAGDCTQTQTRARQRDRVQARVCRKDGQGACEGKAAGACEQRQMQRRSRAQNRACKSK